MIEKQSTCPGDIDYSNDHRLSEGDDIDSSEDRKIWSHSSQNNITGAPTSPLSNQLNLFDGSISLSLANTGSRVISDVKYSGKYDKLKSARSADESSYKSQKQCKKHRIGPSINFEEPNIEIAADNGFLNADDDSLDVGLFTCEAKFK